MNLISILIGAVALVAALVAFIPLLGWLYWIVIPVAIVGLAVGLFSDARSGRNLNVLVIVVGALRLIVGGGIV